MQSEHFKSKIYHQTVMLSKRSPGIVLGVEGELEWALIGFLMKFYNTCNSYKLKKKKIQALERMCVWLTAISEIQI